MSRFIYSQLKEQGGILTLDSEFDDTFQISVFLLDYLTDDAISNKDFQLVSLSACIAGWEKVAEKHTLVQCTRICAVNFATQSTHLAEINFRPFEYVLCSNDICPYSLQNVLG